jgi:TetR/AcrR family transcriptional regulator, lmrAB and yxaGH operons repressor
VSRPATGSRDRIVDATMSLLRRGGLSASGVNNVVAEGRAPKGSLYHYFPGGKQEMVVEALQRYTAAGAERLRQCLGSSYPISRRVKSLFRDIAEGMARDNFTSSCAIGAVTLDLGPDDDALRAACAAGLSEWAQVASEYLPEIPKAKRRAAADLLISLLEGAERSAKPLMKAEESFLTYLEALQV